jgi:nucleotide-binding universal stress UspA family protein
MAAALPQSHPHPLTDGGGHGRTYAGRVFASILVVLAGQTESPDALVLAAQLADADGAIVVAHVMATSAAPLTGGTQAAARRRARLRDAGQEIYATLGPDPRVRYLPLSGLPFADAVGTLARRERPDVIVVGQNLLGHEPGIRQLLADAPCPLVVAPHGHRFARAFAPARITVGCGPPGPTDRAVGLATALAERIGAAVRLIAAGERAEDWLAHAQGLAPAAAATHVADRGARALLAQTSPNSDLLVIAGADDEILRQAACPVLVTPQARLTRPLAA